MRAYLRSANAMRTLALALLTLALVAIAIVHYATQRTVAIQGPGVLQVIDAQTVWLGVNTDLWILDAQGHRKSRKTAAELGLHGAVSNIALAPAGQALLTSRKDLAWQVVNTTDLSRVRTIVPQWPEQFKDNPTRAIHIAVSASWDIAVATGGGHAILLFDSTGKFIRRSHPGLYRFTNGLWHSPDGWWTTDTNRFELKLLDTHTLALKDSITLKDTTNGYEFLGELAASKGAPEPASGQAPVATVSRLGFLMEPGHVVDVFPNGRQAIFNKTPMARVSDIAWFNDQLLVVDGDRYQVSRFSSTRDEMPRFGDAEVHGELDEMLERRLFWTLLSSRYMFLIAAGLLLLGIAAYSRYKKVSQKQTIALRVAKEIGTPCLTTSQYIWQWFSVVAAPYGIRIFVFFFSLFWLLQRLVSSLSSVDLGLQETTLLTSKFLSVLVPVLPIIVWLVWERYLYQKASANPAREAILNRHAVAWLNKFDDWDQVKLEGETPRESITLLGWRRRWLVVSNKRILLFAAGARERRLVSDWPRSSISEVSGMPTPLEGALQRWWRKGFRTKVNLYIKFTNGDELRGLSASSAAATRVITLLEKTAIPSAPNSMESVGPDKRNRRWYEVLASLAIPGLGQLLQDRFVSGAVFLTAAIILFLLGVGPVIWASTGPKMDVSFNAKLGSAIWWLLLAVIAAWDTWPFSRQKKPRRAVSQR